MAIREGTIIILFPNEWHRYKPDKGTGWDEYWVGFKGNIADNLVTNHFLNPAAPCIQIGVQEQVVSLFDEIIEKTKEAQPSYYPLIPGLVYPLPAPTHSIPRTHPPPPGP